MKENDNVKLLAVFSGQPWEVEMMQNVLLGQEIPAFVKNGLMGSIEPWALTSGGFNPCELMVSDQHYETALEVISDFNSKAGAEESTD